MSRLFFTLIVGFLAIPTVYAQECSATAQNDDGCTQTGKYIARDKFGKVIISVGKCATSATGDVVCSDTPDGGAMQNRYGQVVTGKGKCMKNKSGEVICAATQGGGAEMDKFGEIKTGPGRCIRNRYSEVICSSEPYGAATLDNSGMPVCAGSCVAGQ